MLFFRSCYQIKDTKSRRSEKPEQDKINAKAVGRLWIGLKWPSPSVVGNRVHGPPFRWIKRLQGSQEDSWPIKELIANWKMLANFSICCFPVLASETSLKWERTSNDRATMGATSESGIFLNGNRRAYLENRHRVQCSEHCTINLAKIEIYRDFSGQDSIIMN
jgi:hypothetical protein